MIDSHAHINDEKLYTNYKEIINNAKLAGVNKIVIPGWNVESSKLAIKIAHEFEGVYAAVGVHAQNVSDETIDSIKIIEELAKDPKVVCIGEIGIDYHYTKDDKDIQIEFFKRQLDLAVRLNLPCEIHLRDATGDFMDIIRDYVKVNGVFKNKPIMHSFSESKEIMEELIRYGFYISLSGPVTFKNARVQKEVATVVPVDKLLTETDSPYMAPTPLRGTMNEPKNIPYILEEISNLKNMDKNELERIIDNNFNIVFNTGD